MSDEYEERLIEAIERLRREYEEAIRPYVERLAYIRSLRSPAPVLLDEAAYRLIARGIDEGRN